MSFPRYPKYKPSGVEWLGDVPSHWHVDRLKRSTQDCRNGIWGDEPGGNDNDIPCVRVADFDRDRLRVVLSEPTIRNVTEREREGRLLSRGDLLLEKSGGGETQPVGCVVLYDDHRPAVCSNFVARVRLRRDMDPSFWRYQHAAAYAVGLNTRSIKQTSGLQNLDQQQYLDERAVFPPLPEQVVIATFLDRETAKIDTLMDEQRRLMELLQEKRQAVISHAVTKGLNPDAPMNASGIEWLGDVPAHWRAPQLARAFRSVQYGISDALDTEGEVAVLRMSNIDNGKVVLDDLKYTGSVDSQLLLEQGDLLFNRTNSVDLVGKVGLFEGAGDGPVSFASYLVRMRTVSTVVPRFLAYLLNTDGMLGIVRSRAFVAIGQCNLNPRRYGEIVVPLPPSDEQTVIVDYLNEATGRLDTLVGEAQRAIDLLQERRTALISAAVTGQIDVRGLVPSEAA